jgi:hypothetical protein
VAIICIDFGTSSIRAALRDNSGSVTPLALNERPSIDNASIPSAYAYSEGRLYFGEAAIARHTVAPTTTLLETSPKSWFFGDKIDKIDTSIATTNISRFAAVAGLVALGASRALSQAKRKIPAESIEFRISHPIWQAYRRSRIYSDYNILTALANNDSGAHLDWEISLDHYRHWLDNNVAPLRAESIKPDPDPEEPIAAAIELIGAPKSNSRNPILVVDIGAGTTDLAVFQQLMPSSGTSWKLCRLGNPMSIGQAGDTLDRILLKIAEHCDSATGSTELKNFENEIRLNKEKLFSTGTVFLPHSRKLKLAEFTEHHDVQTFAATLQSATEKLIASAPIFEGSGAHQNDQIAVIYAGGGGSIDFIRSAVARGIRSAKPRLTPFLYEYAKPSTYSVSASYERMAVSMGGTRNKEDWPIGMTRPLFYPGLG